MRDYDIKSYYHEGDIVQITTRNKEYNGKVGEIIGIGYVPNPSDEMCGGFLKYTVKFSDRESRDFTSMNLKKIRAMDYEPGGKDIDYETR